MGVGTAAEDSFMWVDPRGFYHSLFHSLPRGVPVGGHAFSRDGINWLYSKTAAYYSEVALGKYGSKVTFHYH